MNRTRTFDSAGSAPTKIARSNSASDDNGLLTAFLREVTDGRRASIQSESGPARSPATEPPNSVGPGEMRPAKRRAVSRCLTHDRSTYYLAEACFAHFCEVTVHGDSGTPRSAEDFRPYTLLRILRGKVHPAGAVRRHPTPRMPPLPFLILFGPLRPTKIRLVACPSDPRSRVNSYRICLLFF